MAPGSGAGAALPGAVASLAYLEWRRLVHRVRLIVAAPKKLLLWLLFLALLAPSAIMNMTTERPKTALLGADGVIGALPVPSLVLIILGAALYIAARGAPGLFTAAADGRFLVGSGISPRILISWLQLRGALRYVLLMLFTLGWTTTSRPPGGLAAVLTAIAAIMLTTSIVFGLRLPVLAAVQRWGTAPFLAIGWASIVVGALGGGAAILRAYLPEAALPQALLEFAPDFPPGSWVAGAFAGDPSSILPLFILALVLSAATVATAGDVIPELWAASTRMFILRTASRRGGMFAVKEAERELRNLQAKESGLAHDQRARSVAGESVPTGVWTLLWKEWLARARRTSGLPAPVWVTILALGAGVGLGVLARFTSNETVLGMVSGGGGVLFLGSTMTAGRRLADDLSKPLWWLSAASLEARLAVSVLVTTLLWVAPAGGGLAVYGAVAGQFMLATWSIPLVGGVYWLLYTSALVLYTGMPAGGLMNPPMMMLRALGTIAFLIPAALVAFMVALTAHSLGLGRTGATHLGLGTLLVAVVAEGWVLVRFAATRIRGHGLEFALEEQR